MDRKKFVNSFPGNDEFLLASLRDDIELCEEIDYAVYTKFFYPPQIWSKLLKENFIPHITFKAVGLNESSERKLIAIFPQDFEEDDLIFPIKYFKILGNNRFKELLHKDFLGTIMSLGIKREFLGDIVVKDGDCYGMIEENLFSLLSENITTVGNIPVKIMEIERDEIPHGSFEEMVESVSSLRLDALVGSLAKGSRNSAVELLEEGLVTLNYNLERDKSKSVRPGDIISIRKKGKFIFEEILGESKKGKTRILIRKFI